MIPTRLVLAKSGLRAAIQEMAMGEERAHAFLDSFQEVAAERREALPMALAALDRVDAALHDLRLAVRDLELRNAEQPREMVQLRERAPPSLMV
jgi:hypothetical protein